MDSTSACILVSILCVGPGEEYNTDIPDARLAFQNAIDNVTPGDTIKIRGGVYHHVSRQKIFLDVNASGTSTQPITIEAFEGEKVILKGYGFTESNRGPHKKNETLVRVRGDYIHIYNLELSNSSGFGLEINGNYGVYEDITVHDSWFDNVAIGRENVTVEKNLLRHIESYRSRHGSGIVLIRRSTHSEILSGNNIVESISYNNGYQPDGQKVPSIKGDPAGGGNSDGFGSSKFCHDRATKIGVINLCPKNIFEGNIAWHNADDGFDNSFGDGSMLINNIAFNNGPEGRKGFKGLRHIEGGVVYLGNIAIGNDDRGLEPRFTGEGYLYHNLAAHNPHQGIILNVKYPTPNKVRVYNNLSIFNNSPDIVLPSGVDHKSNWAEDHLGNPKLANQRFTGKDVDTSFDTTFSIQEKVSFIKKQFEEAFIPRLGSPLIDSGTFVPGVHCESADDDTKNPMPLSKKCRHWLGAAPDIGAYEHRKKY